MTTPLDLERFKRAVAKVLDHEGGYSNDPDDPGGETNFGISKRSYPAVDIKHLTRDEAEAIYLRDWWQFYGYELIASEQIAAKVFDLSVNMGASRAHKLLQASVNAAGPAQLAVDGQLGMVSMEAINDHPHSGYLLATLKLAAVNYYVNLGKGKYLSGWIRRALS